LSLLWKSRLAAFFRAPSNLEVAAIRLVLIDQFHVESIHPFESEDDAPIRPNRHRPESSKLAFERVKTAIGEIESLLRLGGHENGKNFSDHLDEIEATPTSIIAFVESLEPAMLKALDDPSEVYSATCQLSLPAKSNWSQTPAPTS